MPRKDYDAIAMSEPFEIVVGGKLITLPPELPGKLVMDLAMAADNEGNIGEAHQKGLGMRIIVETVGQENWDYILEHLGHKRIEMFMQDMLSFYGIGAADDEAAPKAGAPPAAQAAQPVPGDPSPSITSSPTGEPSTLTSSAFGLIPGGRSTQAS